MNNFKVTSLSLIAILLIILTSCVDDINTGQINDLELNPAFDIAFIYATKNTESFNIPDINPTIIIPQVIVQDTTNFPLANNSTITKNIEKIEFTYEIRNTFKKDFIIEFKYIGNSNALINTPVVINVDAGNGPSEPAITTIHLEELNKTEIKNLQFAKKIVSTIKAVNVPSDIDGELILRSKGTYFTKVSL